MAALEKSRAAQMANINFVFITYSFMDAKCARYGMTCRCANPLTIPLGPAWIFKLEDSSAEKRGRSVARRR